jgi:2-(1,2-epoxy-1,2-dihydrophenyl)acetyl-CoA isomerase
MTAQTKTELRVDKRGDAVVLTLDRPQRGNTLTAPLVAALADAVQEAVFEKARAIVLTGSPPAFCAGGDLTYLGAGLDLAAICDFRIASYEATFASTWINVGLIPGMGGATWLTRLVGGTRAAQLVLTGETIDATTAERWNLVNDVVAPDELIARSLQLAAHLSFLPPIALARSKAALRRAIMAGVESELDIVGGVQGGLLTGAEVADRAALFGRSDGETCHPTSGSNRC